LVRTQRVKKAQEMKKDDTVRNLESKFDRETLAVLLGIDKRNTKYCNAVITLTLLLKPQ
jgi:hypothetical protein